jgi:hypothetical protein
MEAGDILHAVVQLGLVLRVSPGLAPAVLDVAGSTAGAGFDLVRGDAYRLVGHEAEAQRAYAAATATLSGRPAAPGAVTPGPEPAAFVEGNGPADAAGATGTGGPPDATPRAGAGETTEAEPS